MDAQKGFCTASYKGGGMVIVFAEGRVLGTHSWVDGFKPVTRRLVRLSEEQATCHAAWLEKHLSFEVAYEFIDRWHAGYLFEVH